MGKDAENPQSDVASQATLEQIRADIAALRAELAQGRPAESGPADKA